MATIDSLVEFLKDFIAKVVEIIKKVQEFKELTGEEKMARVNAVAYDFFDKNYDKYIKMNFIVKAYLKKKLRKLIPTITQKIYDLIAMSIEGITNKIK